MFVGNHQTVPLHFRKMQTANDFEGQGCETDKMKLYTPSFKRICFFPEATGGGEITPWFPIVTPRCFISFEATASGEVKILKICCKVGLPVISRVISYNSTYRFYYNPCYPFISGHLSRFSLHL